MRKLPTSPPPSVFPSDVLKWMKKNAAPRMALKLMQICKYFQHQEFPYFVVKRLSGREDRWIYHPLQKDVFLAVPKYYQNIDLNILTKKLWIIEELSFWFVSERTNSIETFLPKVAVCDIHILDFRVQSIKFEEFKILTASGTVTELHLENAFIKNNGKNVPLEDILEILPNICKLQLSEDANSFVSYESAIEKVPQSFKKLTLQDIRTEFNFEDIFKFIQNNQKIYLMFFWNTEFTATDENIQKIQILTDNLIEAWSPQYQPPWIWFMTQTMESIAKLQKLKEIFEQSLKAPPNLLGY